MQSFETQEWKSDKQYGPLVNRIYRPKNAVLRFFCPLCGTERAMNYRSHLVVKNYLQVVLISLVLILASYPFMGVRALVWPFVVWGVFEGILKLLYRKEIPCPHCGFDAAWYRRDVRVAKKLVKQFWEKKENKKDFSELRT